MIAYTCLFVNPDFASFFYSPASWVMRNFCLCQNITETIIIPPMSQSKNETPSNAPISFRKSVGLIIIFVFAIVSLFGIILFLFISGAQQLGIPTVGYIAIFVVISGIFAWLVKRLSDTVSGMSHLWFPEESDEQD